MGLLTQFRQLAGVGIELKVELPYRYFVPGSVLPFHITLTSEERATIREVTAELLGGPKPTEETLGNGAMRSRVTVEQGLVVEKGQPYHLSGRISLPEDAEPSRSDAEGSHHWFLRVTADLPNGVDPSATIGFVVAHPCSFEWQTREPLEMKIPGKRWRVMARGSCTVVRPDGTSQEELKRVVGGVIPIALLELLEVRTSSIKEEGETDAGRHEIAGALREIVNPLVRDLDDTPLDSVIELTLLELAIDCH